MRVHLALVAAVGLALAGCDVHHHYHRGAVVQIADGMPRAEAQRPRQRPKRRRPLPTHRASFPAAVPYSKPASYERPIPALTDGCAPPVRVVGPDAWTEKGALYKARRAWASQVRFDLGERFSDLRRARDINVACAPASGNESTVGKVGKRLTGPLAVRDRCVVTASPCAAGE